MSLQDYLGQYSRDITARQQHQNDTDTAVSERKAQTLEEKFQNARDAIMTGGAELGGAGAAIHLGRKVYRQVQDRKSARLKAQSDANSNATNQQTRTANQGGEEGGTQKAADPDSQAGSAPKQGADDPISKDDSFFPDSKGSAETDDIFSSFPDLPKAPLGRTGGMATGTGDAPAVPSAPQRQQAQNAEEARDPATATDPASVEHGGENAPATESSDPSSRDGINDRADANSSRVAGEGESGGQPDILNTRSATALQESRPANIASSSANDAPSARVSGVAGDKPVAPADVEEGAQAFSTKAASAPKPTGSVIDGAEDAGTQLAKKAGSGLGDALSGVSDALDFLGPVGEIAGVITGLVGLFEGVGHQDKPATGGVQGQFAQQSAGGGIDTTALTSQAKGANMGIV
jgi:hypothetical protein